MEFVNIFNGEAPPTGDVKPGAKHGVAGKSVQGMCEAWKQVLGNKVGDEMRSRAWCKRALLRIYANQELDEQQAATVIKRNGVGFTPADAKLLTSFAEQLKWGGALSPKQWQALYAAMPKYAGQLRRCARDNQ